MNKLNIKVTVKQDQIVYVQGKPLTLRHGKRYNLAHIGSICLIELAENVYTKVSAKNILCLSVTKH